VQLTKKSTYNLIFDVMLGNLDGVVGDHTVLDPLSQILCTDEADLAISHDLVRFVRANNYG